jgi:two-component system sensor histidine kinase PilS (NtrC family)
LDALVEDRNRAIRGSRALIALRLLVAVVSLAILLLQESRLSRVASTGRVVSATGEVTALTFSPDGKRLYSGGSDATVRRWDPATGTEVEAVIEGHGDLVTRLALSPDGKRLASAGADKTARIYNLEEDRWENTLNHEHPVYALAWSPDGAQLLTGGSRNPLQVWNARTGQRVAAAREGSEGITFAGYLADGREIVTTDSQGRIRFWKAEDLTPSAREKLEGHLRAIQAAALSKDRRWLVTGGGILCLWDLNSRTMVWACEGQEDEITALSFSVDNEHFLTAGRDRQLMLWSVKSRQPLRTFGQHPDWVLAAALSPDAKLAATGTGDRTIRLWSTETGEQVNELAGHRRTLRTTYTPTEAKPGAVAPKIPPLALRPEGLVIILMCALSIFYAIIQKRAELVPKLVTLQVVVDLGLISALVYQTGGADSPFVTLYLISITAGAFVLSWRGAVTMAALAATLFSLLTLAYGLGWIPETFRMHASEAQLRKFGHLTTLDYVNLLLLPVLGFFLVALLAGTLSRRLALARLLHHEVLEGIGEGILVLDLERKVLYHNHEVRRLLLWEDRIEGKALGELLGEPMNGQAEKALANVTARRLEFTYRRRDGLLIPFEGRILPFRDPEGPPRGLIVVLDDITAEKKMEEFYKHKERLETMGQLSATIAHEIRNPLASIRGAVQEIARSVEIPENKKILIEIVLSESDRLDQIITDFLRYARVRPPKLAKVDLCQLLTDIRLLLAARPEGKDVQIALEAAEDVEPIQADPEQLRQFVLNLGLNALQAVEGRPEQKLTFRLINVRLHDAQGFEEKLKADRVNRPGVRVEIADTGRGMTEEVRKQLFEPFFTTKPNGTGLGLATVERLVSGHQGLIGVQSTPEVGTSFFVWLPADLESEPQDTTKSARFPARKA